MYFLDEDSVDAIITSPPYLGKEEYVKAYLVGEALLFKRVSRDVKRIYIGLDVEREEEIFPELDSPKAANAYLLDLKKCLAEMYRVLCLGGKVGVGHKSGKG